MEDRYLFRAKRDDNGEWVEGFLFLVNDVPYILPHHNTGQPIHGDNLLSVSAEVQKDTICRAPDMRESMRKIYFSVTMKYMLLNGVITRSAGKHRRLEVQKASL